MTARAAETVLAAVAALMDILDRKDPRLFVMVGPVLDPRPVAGARLRAPAAQARRRGARHLLVVMRVYFEKPRTTTGWKGFINDPRMDDSFHIEEGMERGAPFLLDVAELGLPAATEALDPISPQYYRRPDRLDRDRRAHHRVADAPRDGLAACRRRSASRTAPTATLESRSTRILSPRIRTASWASTRAGRASIVRTAATPTATWCCAAAAGVRTTTRCRSRCAEQALTKAKLPRNIVVDCSHANRCKKPELQPLVMRTWCTRSARATARWWA